MEEHEIADRLFAYAFYALAVLAFLGAVFSLNADIVVVACVLLLLSGIFLNSGHIINNFLLRRGSVVEVYNGYRLSGDLGAAVKRLGNGYRAVSMAVLDIYRGAAVPNGGLDGVLESITQPFEFSVAMREMDKKALLDNLQTKRRMKEIAVSKLGAKSYDAANELNREIQVIESDINTIKSGGKPMELAIRIKAYADSIDDAEAARWSSRNLAQIANSFSTALSLDYETLKGEELLSAIEVSA